LVKGEIGGGCAAMRNSCVSGTDGTASGFDRYSIARATLQDALGKPGG
jgi:hypothetical protein